MRPTIDINKLKNLPTAEDMFEKEYGAKGTASREEFDAKSLAWYYAEAGCSFVPDEQQAVMCLLQ